MTLQEAAELDQKINELKRQTDPGIAAQFRDDVNLFAMYLSRQTVAEQAMEIIDELQKELEERKADEEKLVNYRIEIGYNDFQQLIIESFRYSATRPAGAAMMCVLRLERYWPELMQWVQKQIQNDIKRHAAEQNGMYGAIWDEDMIREWKKVLEWEVKKNDE